MVDPELERQHRAGLDTLRGALEKRLKLYYLAEVGFSLALGTTYTWAKSGRTTLKAPTRWSRYGRLNLMGALEVYGEKQTLRYQALETSVKSEHVLAFLERLADTCSPGTSGVVVLDNATFHRAKMVQAKRPDWEARGLYLRFLPPYCLHLNLIECLWKRLKAWLLPRRFYHTLKDLRLALT